jgi:spore maturation protein CgeB
MIKKIDVLMTRTSQYRVLHHFTSKIYEAFARHAELSVRLLEGDDIVIVPHDDPPDFTVGFNGAPRNPQEEMFCDNFHIPHLSLLVDPPYRFFYLTKSPYTIIGCDDRFCCKLLEVIDFKRTLFVPHAVEKDLTPEPKEERIFDIVMLATFGDHEERRKLWKTLFPSSILKVMDDAIERTFSDSKLSFIAALEQALLEDQKKHPLVPFEGVFLSQVLEELELYIKGRDRMELLKSIPDLPIHVFGNHLEIADWTKYLGAKRSNIHIHGSVSYTQALEIMKKTKILLNPSIKNKEGAHERVFSGLACGALVVTYDSQFLRETYTDKQGLIFYAPPTLTSLQDQIQEYLDSENKRIHEVEAGRAIAMRFHTWDNRVQDILNHVPSMLPLKR